MSLPRRSLALGALALLVGCDACDPSDAAPHLAPADPFCAVAIPALCAQRNTCAPVRFKEATAECVARERPRCDADLERLRAEVAAGRLAWSQAAADRCVAALAAPRCGSVFLRYCTGVFTPRVAAGGICFAPTRTGALATVLGTEECQAGRCPWEVCGATCPASAPIGGDCSTLDCGEAGSCVWQSGGGRRCEARRAPGERCGNGLPSCQASAWCADPGGAPCPFDTVTACACRADLAAGDPCALDDQCPAPLVCGDGRCRGLQGALGESCYAPAPWTCQDGLACLENGAAISLGTCAPLRALGETCSASDQCADGLVCRVEGRCGVPGSLGAPCAVPAVGIAWDGECATGLQCVAGTYQPLADQVGAPCTGVSCFGAGLYCAGTACAPVAVEGESCAPPAVCQGPGLSCDAQQRCRRGVAGTACTLWWTCESGRCGDDGRCAAVCAPGP
jgi:hypothetical protein